MIGRPGEPRAGGEPAALAVPSPGAGPARLARGLREILAFRRDALALFRARGCHERGLTRLDFGIRTGWVVCDPALAVEALTDDDFEKGHRAYGPLGTMAGFGALSWLIGPSLPVLDGPEGAERRRRVRPAYPPALAESEHLRAAAPPLRLTPPAGGVGDVYPMLARPIFERYCAAMFGDAHADEAARISATIARATTALDVLSKSFVPFARWLHPTAHRLRAHRSVLLGFARRVRDRLEARRAEGAPPAAIERVLDGRLSPARELDEIVTQLVAGTETSTITACWAMALLAEHPEVLRDIRARRDRAQMRAAVERVVKETMRLRPAFWTLIRLARRQRRFADAVLSPGDVLFVSPFCVHHNPRVWPEPERFRPERFVDRRGVRGDFVPFGYGGRACLGGRISTALVTDCLLAAVEQLEWAFDGPPPVMDPLIVVLKSRTGFRFAVTPREATP